MNDRRISAGIEYKPTQVRQWRQRAKACIRNAWDMEHEFFERRWGAQPGKSRIRDKRRMQVERSEICQAVERRQALISYLGGTQRQIS
jgi:hypothetical protein